MGQTVERPDPLTGDERAAELARARPRRLPIAPDAYPGARDLPLLGEVRDVDRRYRPIYAVWEITLACDLACRHCGSRAGRERPDELSTAECLDLVNQMADLGVKEVSLIGGEAYLREDWLDIIREIRRRGMSCGTTTGGRGLTAERVAKAKAAGLMAASVSLDGDEATHDRLRGVTGSYRAALEAMKAVKDAGMRLFCNTQINRLSMPLMGQILENIAAVGVRAWQIQLTVPMGRAADEPDVLLQPYDLLELFPMLAHLKKRCDELGVRLFPGNNIGYFGPYESILRGHYPRGHGGSCGAGRGTLGIEANGAIKGCPSLPTTPWTGGNIRDASLKDIWERADALRYTRDRTPARDLWGYCQTCYYAEECMSGCTWTSFVTLGRAGNNPYCHHRAIEMARDGKRERVVRVELPQGQPFDHGVFAIVVEDTPPGPSSADDS
ncbi:MAG TPA: radical SAM protein [Polyangiaceae bacterium]|nr:radical SAM protein [Polyangiaceae bacterium]